MSTIFPGSGPRSNPNPRRDKCCPFLHTLLMTLPKGGVKLFVGDSTHGSTVVMYVSTSQDLGLLAAYCVQKGDVARVLSRCGSFSTLPVLGFVPAEDAVFVQSTHTISCAWSGLRRWLVASG